MAFAYITQRRYFEYPFHVIKSLLGKGVRYLKNDEINTNRNLIHFTLNNYGNLIQLQRTWNMHKMSTFYSPSFYIKYLWRRSIRYIRYVLCADVKMTYLTDYSKSNWNKNGINVELDILYKPQCSFIVLL